MKLSIAEQEAARRRRQQYEANMAVEGIELSADDRAILDELDAKGIGGQEAIDLVIQRLRERGVIPEEAKASFAAE